MSTSHAGLVPAHATAQTVAKEYATRYLEQLGIAPSKSTLDLVHRHVPLTEKNIATTLRVRAACALVAQSCLASPRHALVKRSWQRQLHLPHARRALPRVWGGQADARPSPQGTGVAWLEVRHWLRHGAPHDMQAKGHVSDELQLLVPPVTHAFRVPKVIHAHDILQLGITNGETKSPQAEVRGRAPRAWASGGRSVCAACALCPRRP